MSNESILAENVVLEVAEVIGTEEVSERVITGYRTINTMEGCKDRPGSYDQAFNSVGSNGITPTPGLYGQLKVMYRGDSFIDLMSGFKFLAYGTSPGCGGTTVQIVPGVLSGLSYRPQTETKIILLRLADSSGASWDGSPLVFWGSANPQPLQYLRPRKNNNLYSPPDNLSNLVPQNSQELAAIFSGFTANLAANVQGRCLYMKKAGETKTYCWDVIDQYHFSAHITPDNNLLVMGNGKDRVSQIQNIFPDFYNGNGGDYNWYVSSYIHSGLWDSSGSGFTWASLRESQTMSYYGEYGESSYHSNECFANTGYLGLRSSAFECMYDQQAEGYDCYELEINVTTLTNARIHIFEGDSDDPTITPTNPQDITTTGIHKICLSALKRASRWSGLGNGQTGNYKGRVRAIKGIGSLDWFDAFAGSVTLLEAQHVNTNNPAILAIEYIKLTRKTPDLTSVTEPIYGNKYFYDIDKLSWNYLDVLESRGVPLSLNFSAGDLRDIGKKTTGYSKTFNIPASAHNNTVLDPMLSVGSERQNISWMKSRIQSNGVYVFHGLMRVEEGSTGEGGYFKCHIIQDTIDWSMAIGEAKLCDIPIGEENPSIFFGGSAGFAPAADKTSGRIIDSWSRSAALGDSYFYGLVNYGEWFAQSVNTSTTKDYTHSTNDFHPCVFAYYLLHKIFASIGYTLSSRFVESNHFKILCHPFSSGAEYVETGFFGEEGSQFCHVEKASYTQPGGNFQSNGEIPPFGHGRTWYPDIVPGSDVGNNWSQNGAGNYNNGWTSRGDGYTAPFNGYYNIFISCKFYCSYSDWGGPDAWLHWDCLKNGVDAFPFISYPTWYSQRPRRVYCNWTYDGVHSSDGVTKWEEEVVWLDAGDHVNLRITGGNNGAFRFFSDVSNLVMDIYPIPSAAVPDSPVNFENILPCDKQIDYIKGLTEMFNLQWTADEEKKTVYTEPYNDFFGSGKTVDWSDKLDYTTWGDKFIIEELAKDITFKYKEDTGDTIIEKVYDHREEIGKPEYKSHTETNEEKFRKEVLEMGTKYFHSTLQFEGNGTWANPHTWSGHVLWGDRSWTDDSNPENPIMPVMWKGEVDRFEWYIWGGNLRPEYSFPGSFKMRILNYYGKHKCARYAFMQSTGIKLFLDEYPFLGWRNTWEDGLAEDPFCLSWGDHDTSGIISPGLFSKYWEVAYRKMNGGAALRTCWMNLNPVDIATFDYRDLIHLKIDGVSTYWTVNKIIDYKPNQNVLTKVELIEWKETADLKGTKYARSKVSDRGTKETRERGRSSFRSTKDDGMLLLNDSESSVSGTGLSMGRGTIARDNQTVFGNYNQLNSTDILQVGTGIDTQSRTTAFAVTKDGEVEIHGGELAVEDSSGNPHTLVFKEIVETSIIDGEEETVRELMKPLYLEKEYKEEKKNTTGNGGGGGGGSSY